MILPLLFICASIGFLNAVAAQRDSDCVPITECAVALKLIAQDPNSRQTISLLQQAHCRYDRQAYVKCNTIQSSIGSQRFSEQANCVALSECTEAINKISRSSAEKSIKDILGSAYCGMRDTVLVVNCNNIGTHTVTDPSVSDDFSDIANTVLPDPDKAECGLSSSGSKIFGGNETGIDEFPWIGLLNYNRNGPKKYGCHGTLINSRYILTAAHCVNKQILAQQGLQSPSSVVLGEYDTRNETDCVKLGSNDDCADPVKEYSIDKIIEHPQFSPQNAANDIALLKLTEEVVESDFIKPVCLPFKQIPLSSSVKLWVSGWGRTETQRMSPIKLKAEVPFVPRDKCLKSWGNLGENVVCAGIGDGSDTCKGDSGGPLMFQESRAENFITFEVGIVSYGLRACGGGPGVYTYIPKYMRWIIDNIKS